MKIYIALLETGEYPEDRNTSVHWAGIDEPEALRILSEARSDYRVHFELWEAGQCLCTYMRDSWLEGSHWERNSGATYLPLEIAK